ncbi:hypothetical protein B0H67DRAFT_28589 [Lasiosphaeris hirsuta]|uniref:NAD(P)-binding domain-containing protein n=1 Tax=Lasiosphaeris hirsuta TaxID=260670 RepID=A0AA40B9W1_9PEZI|nr:hypothetical protein B0H67DRAFT_28589 [Lasiosphaeris hirsuta]
MAPKVLVTGATGYIGGDAFFALYNAHPEFEYTLVVRNEDRTKLVREKYPDTEHVKLVYGSPSASYVEVLEKEAAKTDVVLHTAESADDVPSATAISNGLLKSEGHSAENPVFWVHICGTGILQWYDKVNRRYGQPPLPSETYDDIASLPRLLTLPDEALHRDVDKIVLATNHFPSSPVQTSIVAPPTIYGAGRGPVNTTSQQLPALARFVLQKGFAPKVGTGAVEWDNVHVTDVSSLLLQLVEIAALDPARARSDTGLFGGQAYFFCANETPHVWGKVAEEIAQEAVKQGYLKEVLSKTVEMDEIPDKSWGTNSKSVASRAKKFLGWAPKGPALEDEITGIVEFEAKRIGAKKIGADA